MKTYQQEGELLNYANAGSALSAGDPVVVGTTLGVATTDIAHGATGELALSGVFELPKVSGAVITQGMSVVFVAASQSFDDDAVVKAEGDVSKIAIAWKAAGDGATTVLVHLDARIGAIEPAPG
jgi:predicted RecA/RadA family phage recombinase